MTTPDRQPALKAAVAEPAVTARTSVAVLIPAYREAEHIGPVVSAALAAELGRVLVVDDGSDDGTAQAARRAGAEVVELTDNCGKGGALAAGAETLSESILVLLDADLVGLKPEHIQALVEPVLKGEAEMSRGAFQGGRWGTSAAQQMAPQLTGQRAILRERLLAVPGLASSRYGVEVAITRAAKEGDWRCVDVPLAGVSQVTKEEKRGFFKGLMLRLKMYRDILGTLLTRSTD